MLAASSYFNIAPNNPLLHDRNFQKREACFFKIIVTSGGARKTTERHRLDAVNRVLCDLLTRLDFRPRAVCDIGVSSEITTLGWLDEFGRFGMPVEMTATDLTMTAYLRRLNRFAKVLTERNRHVLQAEVFGFGVPTMRCRDYLFKLVLFGAIRRALESESRPEIVGMQQTAIPFVSPLLRGRSDIRLLDHDVLRDPPPLADGSADIVRIANLLQKSYFDYREVGRIVRNVRRMCHAGSIVIVRRNADDHVEASLLRLGDDGTFTVEGRIGPGSEVESYLLHAPALARPSESRL